MSKRKGNIEVFILSMAAYGAMQRMTRALEGFANGSADEDDLNDALNDHTRFMDHWFTLPESTHRAVGESFGIPDECLPTPGFDWTALIDQARKYRARNSLD